MDEKKALIEAYMRLCTPSTWFMDQHAAKLPRTASPERTQRGSSTKDVETTILQRKPL